jgi:Uma2 family endonuclease
MTEVEVFYDQSEEVYRHDVVGYLRKRLEVTPNDVPIRLRPDWACEILSPSTASRDLVVSGERSTSMPCRTTGSSIPSRVR